MKIRGELPKECPFCHERPVIARDPLWSRLKIGIVDRRDILRYM